MSLLVIHAYTYGLNDALTFHISYFFMCEMNLCCVFVNADNTLNMYENIHTQFFFICKSKQSVTFQFSWFIVENDCMSP